MQNRRDRAPPATCLGPGSTSVKPDVLHGRKCVSTRADGRRLSGGSSRAGPVLFGPLAGLRGPGWGGGGAVRDRHSVVILVEGAGGLVEGAGRGGGVSVIRGRIPISTERCGRHVVGGLKGVHLRAPPVPAGAFGHITAGVPQALGLRRRASAGVAARFRQAVEAVSLGAGSVQAVGEAARDPLRWGVATR